jgi:hypothetical protein
MYIQTVGGLSCNLSIIPAMTVVYPSLFTLDVQDPLVINMAYAACNTRSLVYFCLFGMRHFVRQASSLLLSRIHSLPVMQGVTFLVHTTIVSHPLIIHPLFWTSRPFAHLFPIRHTPTTLSLGNCMKSDLNCFNLSSRRAALTHGHSTKEKKRKQ